MSIEARNAGKLGSSACAKLRTLPIEGQHEAYQLALACFVRNVGIDQFRKKQEREREAIAELGARLDIEGCCKALRYLGVFRKAPDLIAHANNLEAETACQRPIPHYNTAKQ
jgi:hypothetical protein